MCIHHHRHYSTVFVTCAFALQAIGTPNVVGVLRSHSGTNPSFHPSNKSDLPFAWIAAPNADRLCAPFLAAPQAHQVLQLMTSGTADELRGLRAFRSPRVQPGDGKALKEARRRPPCKLHRCKCNATQSGNESQASVFPKAKSKLSSNCSPTPLFWKCGCLLR